MARTGLCLRRRRDLDFIRFIIVLINCVVVLHLIWYTVRKSLRDSQHLTLDRRTRRKRRRHNLNRIITESDTLCRNFLRIDRRTFGALLEMVRDIGGLTGTKNMSLEEIVAGFLYTLAHHKKNRMIGAYFYRSGETVSRQFHACLMAILKLHNVLLKKPTPIPEDCDDERWKYFKAHPNCKNLYGHAFPHLNALIEIYGKDYATGKPAEGFVEAIENMEKSAPQQVLIDSSDDDDIIVSANETQTMESVHPKKKVKRENTSTRKRGKKEREGANTSELDNLQSFMNDMNVHLSTMANAIACANERDKEEAEMKKKENGMRTNVLNDLLSLEGVTTSQSLKVAHLLIEQPSKLILFYQCPDALKSMFVKELLGGSDDNA